MKDKKCFIEYYLRLIAHLNQEHQSLLWWATDMSSKNRYTCLLPDYIQELMGGKKLDLKIGWNIHLTRIKKVLVIFWFAICLSVRSVLSQVILGAYLRKRLQHGKDWYVIKSFAYDSSFDVQDRYDDAFFGCLPEEISKIKNCLIFVHVLGDYRSFIKKAKIQKEILLVPVEAFLTIGDIIKAVWDICTYHIRLSQPVFFDKMDVKDAIEFELYRNFNGIQIQQFLHYACTRRLLEKITASTFLMTYENNPWERMCALAIRKYSPQTRILGYQHAVVPEAALNMMLDPEDIGIVPLPDRILTVGEVTTEMLKTTGHYPPGMVQTACALRYEYLDQVKPQDNPWRGHVLVVLDGVKQTKALLEYVLAQFQAKEDVKLIFRAHPALPRAYWEKVLGNEIKKYPSIQWSSQSLGEDLLWADVLIYWQSTVALEAIKRGIPVINFTSEDILSYDPLFGFLALRWETAPDRDLREILNKVRHLSPEAKSQQYLQANAFLKRYFYPVTKQGLKTFL